jgi:hypothetical protein
MMQLTEDHVALLTSLPEMAYRSPMVRYHGLGRRHPLPTGFLMRLLFKRRYTGRTAG